MKKKILAVMMATLVALGCVACGGTQENADTVVADQAEKEVKVEEGAESKVEGEKTHIYVLTAPEDHGWTGSVATFAKEKIAEVNEAGTYTSELITAAAAAEQIRIIEDIVSSGEKNIAVVVQPIDDTVQSAIQQIVDAGIPYVAFDRIIEGVASSAVSNVKGDNEGIGVAAAAYFVSLGMQPGDSVYVYEGDTSSVTTLRNQGFTEYLVGNAEFEGVAIDESLKWTEEQAENAIVYSGAMNWNRSDTKTAFESLMGDSSNAEIKWFYAEDDELAMGIIEALNGGGIDDATKEAFYENQPVLSGCGGLDELYGVLRGENYTDVASKFGGLVSVTYSPSMIQTAIQDMVDYLDGSEVAQDHVIACENVTAENVAEYKGF